MKSDKPEGEEAFRNLLKEWRTDAALPPRFQEQVWRRIERLQPQTPGMPSFWNAFAHWISAALSRPALAGSYIAMLLAIGISAGWSQARQETARVKDELGQRYVRVLDPYLTPRQ